MRRGPSQSSLSATVIAFVIMNTLVATLGQQISDLLKWLNSLPDVQKQVAIGLLLSAFAAIFLTVKSIFNRVRPTSRYQQWTALAEQFYDIAKRDNDERLPTHKKKVTVIRYRDALEFRDGSHSHHAAETEALSRIAGKLLRRSKVPHQRHWLGCEPRKRWVEFVIASTKTIDPTFSKDNIHTSVEGSNDDYLVFEVFPFAAHLACKYCASFERLPKP